MMGFKGRRILLSGLCGDQAGYLFEFPLLVLLTAAVAAIVTPLLPAPWDLIPIAALAATWGIFLIYNFFFAGWLPGKRKNR